MKVDTTLTGDQLAALLDVPRRRSGRRRLRRRHRPLGRAVVAGTTNSTSPAGRRQVPARAAGRQLPDVRAADAVRDRASPRLAPPSTSPRATPRARPSMASRRAPAGEIWAVGSTNDVSTNPPTATGVPMVNAEQATYGRGFPGTGGDIGCAHRPDLAVHRPGADQDGGPNPVLPGSTSHLHADRHQYRHRGGLERRRLRHAAGDADVRLVRRHQRRRLRRRPATRCTVSYGTARRSAQVRSSPSPHRECERRRGTAITNTATVTSATRDPIPRTTRQPPQVSTPTLDPDRRRRQRRAHQRLRDAVRAQPLRGRGGQRPRRRPRRGRPDQPPGAAGRHAPSRVRDHLPRRGRHGRVLRHAARDRQSDDCRRRWC